jgi:hypothetical protein
MAWGEGEAGASVVACVVMVTTIWRSRSELAATMMLATLGDLKIRSLALTHSCVNPFKR